MVGFGLQKNTMSNLSLSCIELELGLGFDNCISYWLKMVQLYNTFKVMHTFFASSPMPPKKDFNVVMKMLLTS